MSHVAGAADTAATTRASRSGRGEPLSLERIVVTVERNWRWALAALMLLDALLLIYIGRGLTFFFDDWNYVTSDYGGGIHSLLRAHNGHMSLFPVAIYKVLFHLVGLDHYAVFRLVLIALHLICAGLVFVLVSRRQTRVVALIATALILFLGAAWEDLIWAFQIDYMLSIAGGLAAWVLLEREDRIGDLGATLAVFVSLGSSGLGIPVLVGVVVELACRRDWRRWFVVVVPAILYGLWYLHYGEDELTREGLINSPGFSEDIGAAAFGGIAGRGLDWGRPLALLGVGVLLWRVARAATLSARLVGLLASAIFLWVLTAAARSGISSPETGRYVYLGAVLIVLVAAELLRGVVVRARVLALAAVVVAVFAVTGLTLLRDGADGLRVTSRRVTAELGALELAAARAPADYQPDPNLAPQILAAPYLHTVRAIGSSPADSTAALQAADPASRAAADAVLFALDAPALTPLTTPRGTAAGGPPAVLVTSSATVARAGSCVEAVPSAGAQATVVIAVPSTGVELRSRGAAPVAAGLRRFGDAFVALATDVPPHGAATLSLPADAATSVPWKLQLSSASPIAACGL